MHHHNRGIGQGLFVLPEVMEHPVSPQYSLPQFGIKQHPDVNGSKEQGNEHNVV